MKFSSALSCIIFFIVASTGGSSAELTQHRRSVTVASEDVASAAPHDATMPDDPYRELKKKKGPKAKKTKAPKSTKKPKAPKSAKKPKSSKTLATESPSSLPTEKLTSPQPSSQPTDPCAPIDSQKAALLALKAGFTNADDVGLSDWAADTDPCTGDSSNWTGISCNINGAVTVITAGGIGLTGTISPLIGCPPLVTSLTEIDFINNSLTGTIPSEIGSLTNLYILDLVNNDLTGTVPTEICDIDIYYFFFDVAEVTCDCCYS